jgi:hypothetical protein
VVQRKSTFNTFISSESFLYSLSEIKTPQRRKYGKSSLIIFNE